MLIINKNVSFGELLWCHWNKTRCENIIVTVTLLCRYVINSFPVTAHPQESSSLVDPDLSPVT